MAATLNSFKVEHASGLHAVARKLDQLHQESIRAVAIDEDAPAVRLSVLNLVAVCTSVEDADLASQTVGVLSQSHPCRAIVVFANPDGGDSIEADLSYQRASDDVSSEQVRLNVQGEAALHLASVITPLLVPDIPVYLWLVGSPPLEQAFGDDAIAIAERIVIDSGEYDDASQVLSTLAAHAGDKPGLMFTDIAWTRARVWREMLAQAFDGAEMRAFARKVTRVEVVANGEAPSTQAWLSAGWLGDRLGWRPVGGPYLAVTGSLQENIPDSDLCSIHLSCVGKDHNASVAIERDEDQLHACIDVDGGITARQSVAMLNPDLAHLVAGLLEEGPDDYGIYVAALKKAAEMAAG